MKWLIYVGIVALVIVLVFGFGSYDGIGKSGDPVVEIEKKIPPAEREPDIVIRDPVKTCADVSCKTGYYCTLDGATPYCVAKQELSPAPPEETLQQKGEWLVQILDWDCGWTSFGTCSPILRTPSSPVTVYGYVIVPYSATYVLETGFESLASLSVLTASKSPCDANPYYSGVKKYLEAGKKYYFEFTVKQPAYKGIYNQYMAIFSGCVAEGGDFINGKWRSVVIQ